MQTTESEIIAAIATGIRSQEFGGFLATSAAIAGRMVANRQSLGVTCAKCGSSKVYCCATMHGKGSEVACICVHICFDCGENIPAADTVWRATPRDSVRCFHCDRPVS